jgi:hypothetical protein
MKKLLSIIIPVLFFFGIFAGAERTFAVAIWSMDTDILIWELNTFLDHTYSCVGSYSDCYTFPSNSTKTGGTVNNVGQVDSTTAVYAKIHGECCEDAMIYLVDGVCHQHSNQVLEYAGIELGYGVQGYSVSRWVYGPTGYCMC